MSFPLIMLLAATVSGFDPTIAGEWTDTLTNTNSWSASGSDETANVSDTLTNTNSWDVLLT